ncbi:MAG: hypothetical protein M3459_10075 [Actinomycetota bacterium]|nr:hypothetical protein [Actinomycetota bacterium]
MPALAQAALSPAERRMLDRFVAAAEHRLGDDLISVWLFGDLASQLAEEVGLHPYLPQVLVWDPDWLANRREIRSFFVQEVDRDKIVLYGSP